MGTFSMHDSIDVLNLSRRLSNCLKRTKIYTIEDMMEFPRDELENIRNVGKKSIDEFDAVTESLKSDYESECNAVEAEEQSCRKRSIETLDMSENLREFLNLNNIHTFNDFSNFAKIFTDYQMSIGKGLNDEFISVMDTVNKEIEMDSVANYEINGDDMIYLSSFNQFYDIHLDKVKNIFLKIKRKNPECEGETLTYHMYENDLIKNRLIKRVLELIKQQCVGMTINQLYNKLPKHLYNTTILKEIMLELERDKKVEIFYGFYTLTCPSILEYIETIPYKKKPDVLRRRIAGQTLEEVGESYGVTRERIRQISARLLKNKPKVKEDVYFDIFEKYNFDIETFCNVFNEPVETYNYLTLVGKIKSINKEPVENIKSDDKIPLEMKRKVEAYLYRDYLIVDGIRIPRKKYSIFDFVIKKYCRNKITFENAIELYEKFITDNGLPLNDEFLITSRTYENRLMQSDFILWNFNRSFRYYNIAERDYEEFYDELNLSQYKNMEMSTLKLFKEHKELMKQFDIRDEYELHNLIKKTYTDYTDCEMVTGKMPTLKFGEYNKDEQVIDLLLRYAPISKLDFAKLYEEEYGVKAETVMGSCLDCISEYLDNGIYSVEYESLPFEENERMKEVYTEDFYFISDFQRLYKREFPNNGNKALNSYNIKVLGFKIYSDYVISNRFTNAAAYFRNLLTKDDVMDLNAYSHSLFNVVSFSSELYLLRGMREIIEFLPKQYLNIRRLEQIGITRENLSEYCNNVYKFAEKSSYFTIKSLRGDGFSDELDDLDFDDWFYSSILIEDKEKFSYTKIGGERLIYTGENVVFSDFIEHIIEKFNRFEIEELREYLIEKYGIKIRRDKLLTTIKDTDLYYDQIMDTVYIDYDTYFEEA